MGEIDVRAVGPFGQAIFFGDHARGFLAEQRRIEQIANAQAAACHLVFVGGADAARGGANLVCAAGTLGGTVQLAMIRKNQVRAVAEVQAAFHVHARF